MYMYCMQIQNTPLEINETVKKDIYLLAEISFDKFISSQLAMHSLMKWTHAILCLCISLMKSVSEQSYTPLVYSLNRLQEVQNTSSPQIKGFRSAPLLKWCGSETLDLGRWEHISIVTYCLSECAILLPHNIAAMDLQVVSLKPTWVLRC